MVELNDQAPPTRSGEVMQQPVGLASKPGLHVSQFMAVILTCMMACGACKRAENYDLSTSLSVDEWPVYEGPCFVFQVPVTHTVFNEATGFHDVVHFSVIMKESSSLTKESWPVFIIRASNHVVFVRDSAARHIEIGGVDAWAYEWKEGGRRFGDVRIQTPLHFPRHIDIEFRDQDGAGRDLAMQVAKSVRLNTTIRNYRSARRGAPIVEKPLWDYSLTSPTALDDDLRCFLPGPR